MDVVAIHGLTEGKEGLADKLAAALGSTTFEALSRLRSPGNGPLVVAVFSDGEPAGRLVERLRAGGFHATQLSAAEIAAEAGRPSVGRFSLEDETIRTKLPGGGGVEVPYRDIEVLLRGTSIVRSTSSVATNTRSFSPGRAVLSGGLMLTKTTKSVKETTSEARESFVVLYAADGISLGFYENSIAYDLLGQARQPTSAANFAYLVGELRRLSGRAVYDERLLRRPAQAALLGPRLSPETYLHVATGLLVKVLRRAG